MSNSVIIGMVVYHRHTLNRGLIGGANLANNMILVKWDAGYKEILHVNELMSEQVYNDLKESGQIAKEDD